MRHTLIAFLVWWLTVGPLVPLAADAIDYFVSTSGTGNCTTGQNINTPLGNLQTAIGCLGNGDTLYMRGGTYTTNIQGSHFLGTLGTSWATARTIRSYQSESVIIRPSSGFEVINLGTFGLRYIQFVGAVVNGTRTFTVDGGGLNVTLANAANTVSFGSATSDISFIRFENVEVKNAPYNGIFGAGHHHEFLNMWVHDNGLGSQTVGYGPGANGVYSTMVDSIFEGGIYEGNRSIGIRIWNSGGVNPAANRNTIDGVIARNNGRAAFGGAITTNGTGINIGDSNNVVKNSIVTGNQFGIQVQWDAPQGTANTGIYNNTVYSNTITGIGMEANGPTNTFVTNNLAVGNPTNISNPGGMTLNNNRTSGSITDCTLSTTDLHLKAGTNPCVDAGLSLSAVTSDFDGVPRPQGATHDIGAYERDGFPVDTTPPAAPQGVTVT